MELITSYFCCEQQVKRGTNNKATFVNGSKCNRWFFAIGDSCKKWQANFQKDDKL